MTKLFIEPSSPLLKSKAEEVAIDAILSEPIQELIELMYAVACGERTDTEKRVMVGLAAPQIGVMKRLILVDVGVDRDRKNPGELKVFINPDILWASPEQEEGREGCYSVDERLWAIVPRATAIDIKAWDRHANLIQCRLTGFTARIFQHERDHLDGIRFPDRIGEKGKFQWVEKEHFAEYRKNWQSWPVYCPWKVWEAMRDGRPYHL